MGRKRITEEEFKSVKMLREMGIPRDTIKKALKISSETIRKINNCNTIEEYRKITDQRTAERKAKQAQEAANKQVQAENLDLLDTLYKNQPVGTYVDKHFKQEVLTLLAVGFEQLLANRPITIEQVLDYIQENSSKTSEMNTLNKVTWLYTSKFNKRKEDS